MYTARPSNLLKFPLFTVTRHYNFFQFYFNMADITSITATLLTAEEYAPYGHVIESKLKSSDANFGTAKRFDFLGTTPLKIY
jgi:hypothetical protein